MKNCELKKKRKYRQAKEMFKNSSHRSFSHKNKTFSLAAWVCVCESALRLPLARPLATRSRRTEQADLLGGIEVAPGHAPPTTAGGFRKYCCTVWHNFGANVWSGCGWFQNSATDTGVQAQRTRCVYAMRENSVASFWLCWLRRRDSEIYG